MPRCWRASGSPLLRCAGPSSLTRLHSLIIPGGESTTIARLILRYGFTEPLRAFCASERPLWGTCAGAILLANRVDELDRPGIEAMDMSVARNAFGRQVDSFEASVDVEGLAGGPFRAIFIRAPVIESVGTGVEVLGRLDDGAIVAARQATSWRRRSTRSWAATRACTSTSSRSARPSGRERARAHDRHHMHTTGVG